MIEATHDLLIDLHEDLLTAAEAALIVHVSEATIRKWVQRGYLTAATTDHLRRSLFVGMDVLRAEAKAAARKRGGLRHAKLGR